MLLLVMAVVMGLAAGLAGQTWRSTMQRAREAELLWRGQQYQQAISSYYKTRKAFPATLEDLVRDPNSPNKVRHLRKLYDDPMTGKRWEPVTDPAKRIIGVRSSSDLEPFQKDGFPEGLDKLRSKNSYLEWEFVFVPLKANQTAKKTSSAAVPGGKTE